MSDQQIERYLDFATDQLRRGQLDGAMDSLRRALGLDPDIAGAHALLALCLVDQRRLRAAEHEMQIGLSLEPLEPLVLLAAGTVWTAQRQFKKAQDILQRLLEIEPNHVLAMTNLAELAGLQGDRSAERAWLDRALVEAPDDPSVIASLARWELNDGSTDYAQRRVREALEIEPEHQDALVLQGEILLRQGRIEEAREHAVWALRHDASDRGALSLMASIKARSSWYLGWWWRYSTWMGELGEGRAIVVLLLAYVTYRYADFTATTLNENEVASLLTIVWYAIVAYSWIGPVLFQNALNKEIGGVELSDEF